MCDPSCEYGEYGTLGCAAKSGKFGLNCRACFYNTKKALEYDTPADRAIMCVPWPPMVGVSRDVWSDGFGLGWVYVSVHYKQLVAVAYYVADACRPTVAPSLVFRRWQS